MSDFKATSAASTNIGQQQRFLMQLYDALRTARLNESYWYTMQIKMRRQESILDIILAITASVLVVLLAVKNNGSFSLAEADILALLLSAEVAVLAIVKPILAFSRRQAQTILAYSKFAQVRTTLSLVVQRISQTHEITKDDRRTTEEALQEMSMSMTIESGVPDHRRLQRMQDQVNKEFPVGEFWMPS